MELFKVTFFFFLAPLDFAMSIDALEEELGVELFEKMYDSEDNKEISESDFDQDKWTFDPKRYRKRITEWNMR